MTITREQANLLADLARTIRPSWDTRAIVSAIGEVMHRPLAEIATAVVLVAENRAFETPKALTFEGSHWRALPNYAPKHPHYVTTRRPEITDRGRAAIEEARAAAARAASKHQEEA